MKKIFLSGLAAGAAMLLASLLLNFLFYAVFPGIKLEYQNPAMFRPWTDPIMQLFYLQPFLLGLIYAWLWIHLKAIFIEHKWNSVMLGFYSIILSLPGMLMVYSSFQISLEMVISWTLSSMFTSLLGSWLVGQIAASKLVNRSAVAKVEEKK